jgi:metallo-beta-lactamase class B
MWTSSRRLILRVSLGIGYKELAVATERVWSQPKTIALPALALLALMTVTLFAQDSRLRSDPPIDCEQCAAWNAQREPFRIFGNTFYVGTFGLSAILVTSDRGLILLDGGLPHSATPIDASIRKLGFRIEDVRLIVNSHAHFDHAGGIAALQQATGATVAASGANAWALEKGGPAPDDPQYAFGGRWPR